jgi:hypothetical protein
MFRTKSILWMTSVSLSLTVAGTATAGCLNPNSFKHVSDRQQVGSPALVSALYQPDSAGAAHAMKVDFHEFFPPSIVGLWRFHFSPELGGDFGTLIWNQDGTEIMVSGARDPAAGDVCMGAWKQTGRYTYELNHIALGHDGPPGGPPSPTFTNTVHLHEHITLDPSGKSYTGTIDAVISAANPANPFDESNVLARVTGSVTATRVEP